MNIGFIGASGLMGHGMAKRLQAKGHTLSITVRSRPERVSDLLQGGATVAKSAAAMASGSEIVFICVTGSPQVESVMLGENGLLAGATDGLLVVDCSTSEPASTAHLRQLCAKRGVVLVDAPLSRSPTEAEAGRLNVMVGAEAAVFARLEPVIRCFAENVLHMGGPGAGHTIKLLNNFVAQAVCTATAEAFAVGQKAGVDLHKFVELVTAGPLNNGLFQGMAKTLNGDLSGLLFELDNARKDVRYYTHLAESLNVPSVMGEAVHQSLSIASALGHGSKYVPSLVEAQEQLSGTPIVPR
ncbi:MAG: NAD(P)-dependent oxidoreductase [Rubrivivax sp.]|nr:NAD(P)-dependent oxidoreductase [Rubrivivax sp.]